MDTMLIRCLINSISRFVHLVSCQTRIPMCIQKDCGSMVLVLKHLKSVLDEVADYPISSDEILYKECVGLDMTVDEAHEFMENWSPKMSKICCVLQSEALAMKVQCSSLEICHLLCRLSQSSEITSTVTSVQHCIEENKSLKQDRITEHIEEVMRAHRDDVVPCSDHLTEVIESLSLTSNRELLKESVAVEKKRINVLSNKEKGDLDQIERVVDFISLVRAYLLKADNLEPRGGVPIPSYFLCPLSLELMLDPVIVASGQTYERASIQIWLDHGLNICPKTRQTLAHTNFITNYTVKAMIANWCEENNIRASRNSECINGISVTNPSNHNISHSDSYSCSLRCSNSTSRSTLEVGNGFEKQKVDVSSKLSLEEPGKYQTRENENFDRPSHELSYTHSRSESTSSAISSIEYVPPASNEESKIPNKHRNSSDLSGEIIECTATCKNDSGFSASLLGKQPHDSRTNSDVMGNGNHNYIRAQSVPFSDFGSDDLTTVSHIKKLIQNLKSPANEVQTTAAAEIRFLAKHNMENRTLIGNCGAIKPLLSLLYSEVQLTQEHAVTALLNLSINEDIKALIAKAGAIEPLIHVLKLGNDGAKENAAAALFSLSVLEEYKAKIGRSGAVKALVDLLGSGTLRGRKDAATALFNLSIFHENKVRMVKAGAVKYLVELMDPNAGMVDKAVALLANLSTIEEGRTVVVQVGGIPLLVEIVESGSPRGKENAASVLAQLCLNSSKFCTLVLQEGAVPPLVALSQSGTPRAKEKAQQLLSHFRSQREGSEVKGKS